MSWGHFSTIVCDSVAGFSLAYKLLPAQFENQFATNLRPERLFGTAGADKVSAEV